MRSLGLRSVGFVTTVVASVVASVVALGAFGCGTDGGQPPTGSIPDHCNPLAGGACLLPWPSMAYAVEDTSTPTGFKVSLPQAAMPVNVDDIAIDPTLLNRYDGFSPNAVIVVAFPTGVSSTGLPPHDDIARSMAADSPIVILNMDTNERLPFFAEVDANLDASLPAERALLIRPLKRMDPASRYVVAIRKSVKAADGGELVVSDAFQALVDGGAYVHPLYDKLAPRYPAIFAALETAGIPKTDLALAWDFVTASDEYLTSDLLAMREQALPMMANGGADLTFDAEIIPGVGDPSEVMRFIVGTFDTPMFLDDLEEDESVMVRGPDGTPLVNGTYRANFAAVIPACAATTRPLPVLILGHGLFGNGREFLDDGLLQRVTNDNCVIAIATDFIGLSNRNIATAAYAVNDINRFPGIIDKLAQSVISNMALSRIIRGTMAADPLFMDGAETLVDPTRVYYYGASLGGIMGNVFMAYEPDVIRGVLGVPGGNWTLNMERSLAWPPLQIALQNSYLGYVLDQEIIALVGMLWDRYDPITTAARIVMDPLPGTPAKQIFIYEGLGDSLVTHLSTEMISRTMGIPVTGPSLYVPYGMQEETGETGSALMILDEHVTPWPPFENIAPTEDSGTHSGVNRRQAVQDMIRRFFLDGVLEHGCAVAGAPAPCDCDTGACGPRI